MPELLGRICNIYPVYLGCWIDCRIKNYRDKKKKRQKNYMTVEESATRHLLNYANRKTWIKPLHKHYILNRDIFNNYILNCEVTPKYW